MTFSTFSNYFEKLEATSSRLALAYESKKEEVLKLYGRLGDMGLVAEKLARGPVAPSSHPMSSVAGFLRALDGISTPVKQASSFVRSSSRTTPRLSVLEVFEILTKIAKTSGEGTVEKRQTLLSDLLKKLDPISAKHLVRIPLGNTRLGIGDPTILDGLATAKLGDKSKRKLLEGAYNRTSDLDLIAKTLFGQGLEAVQKLKVQVGKPIRSELCERLQTPEKVVEKMLKVNAQLKYDGFRVQIHKDGNKVTMFSRNLENMTHMFPELIEGTLKQTAGAKTLILDTEALAYQRESEEFLPFQETTKRRRKHNILEMAKSLPLRAFVFDVLYINGKSLIDTPLIERLEVLKKIVKTDDILIPSIGKILENPKDLQLMLDDAISKGLE